MRPPSIIYIKILQKDFSFKATIQGKISEFNIFFDYNIHYIYILLEIFFRSFSNFFKKNRKNDTFKIKQETV